MSLNDGMSTWGKGVFFRENTPEGCTGCHKSSFSLYKQVEEMVIMNDLGQPMLSYHVIYFEKFRKIMLWTETELLTLFSLPMICGLYDL